MEAFANLVQSSRPYLLQSTLQAALHLKVFDTLLANPASPQELASHLNLPLQRLRALLNVLLMEGFLQRVSLGSQRLSIPKGTPLPQRLPEPQLPRRGWGAMAEVISTDQPLTPHVQAPEILRRYQGALQQAGSGPAAEIAASYSLEAGQHLLDIGGGTGAFSDAFLAASPNAHVTLLDLPEVLELAGPLLSKHPQKLTFFSGEFPRDRPTQKYDLFLLSNLLHLHPPKTCQNILRAAREIAQPNARILIKDLLIEESGEGPPVGVYFSLNMALYTPNGSVYPAKIIQTWLQKTGWLDAEVSTLHSAPSDLVIHANAGTQNPH